MRHISAKEVVGELIELLDLLDVRAHNGLLFLEHPDVPVHLCITELVVLEVLQGHRHLVLSFVVE